MGRDAGRAEAAIALRAARAPLGVRDSAFVLREHVVATAA